MIVQELHKRERERERERERQTDKQTDGQTERQTDIQTECTFVFGQKENEHGVSQLNQRRIEGNTGARS